MPIKIKCPNCEKVLNAPDTLAGKRANCPNCKTQLTVPSAATAPAASAKPPAKAPAAKAAPSPATAPAAAPAAPPPAPAAPAPTPEDLEGLAASLLADEPKPEAAPTDFIEFKCEWCDETVKVKADLAGKKAPCTNPECRRITRVPVPADPKKAAWQAAKKPVGARLDTEAAPEGAWGSTTSRGQVSKESLEDAGALPDQRGPVGARTWIKRGILAAVVVAVLGGSTLFYLDWRAGKRQAQALQKAMAAVTGKEPALTGPEAGLIHLFAGKYHLQREASRTLDPVKGVGGSRHELALARARLSDPRRVNSETDVLLGELALLQLELAGDAKDIEDQRRLSSKDSLKEVGTTLRAVGQHQKDATEARSEAVRQVVRRLLKENQPGLVEEVVRQVGDGPVSLAVAGVELHRAGHTKAAEKLRDQTRSSFPVEAPPPPKEKAQPDKKPAEPAAKVPLTVDVVALAAVLAPEWKPPAGQKEIVEVGKAVALALKGEGEPARQEARKLPTAPLKVEALVAIADALKGEAAKAAAEEAVQVIGGELGNQVVSPWVLVRLVRLGVALGLPDDTVQAVADRVRGEDQLRGWAQFQVFRARLAREKGKADESLVEKVDPQSLSHRLARIELTRHNTARDKGAASAVEDWSDGLKPFGHVGVALGLQAAD